MERVLVDSSCIASIGYDPRASELDLEFRVSMEIYRYFEVPAEEHTAFMSAESKGTYLNEVFKSKGYRYVIVEPEKKRIYPCAPPAMESLW